MTVKIIIPYNFTDNDEKSLEFVADRYVGDKDATVTLFHAYHTVPEINVRNNPIMDKMARSTLYLKRLLEEQKEELEQAKRKLVLKGFYEKSIQCLFAPIKSGIAKDIIYIIKVENYNVVILNHNPGSVINYFSRSISKRVSSNVGGKVRVYMVN